MDLEELRVLVAVAETGSLLGAAEKLGITIVDEAGFVALLGVEPSGG